jgi:uncharacterized protein HemY
MVQDGRSLNRLAVALSASVLLASCSLRPMMPVPAPVPGAASASATSPAPPSYESLPRPPQPAREIRLSPATHALVTQARTQLARGDLPAASSTLDRALRIEPNNPLLWIELGRLRLAESDAHQAEGCGRKALALASGDRGAQSQAGMLLADALRAQRRDQEAREVESQPYMK